ncbi:regulator [Mycobacterium sp. 1245111.1]|nr:regulator [Mycobacterium sp. 1245111.1]
MLGLHAGSVVSADMLLELLWGDEPPRTAAKALQTHISSLRRVLGDGYVLTEGTGWILNPPETDASRFKQVTRMGRDAASAGDTAEAVARFEEALSLWRGTPELPDNRRGISEKTRWIESHAALVEDRADALLATGRAAEIIGELEAAVADAPLRERRWGQLMLALYRAGRQGEALAAFRRARSLLADELGVDPGTELRRLEAAIVAQDAALDTPVLQHVSAVTRAVTFLLTDIEGSTAAWEADSDAMAVALARHDELVEQVVTSRGGRLIKTRGEGDATFSVFDRPSGAAAAALELQDAILHEPWALRMPLRVRMALHTGEAELRDGDYFGRAVNRAARLRSLAEGAQILCSGATAELVIDSLPEDVVLADLGMRNLKNLARPEHVFELRLDVTEAAPPTEADAGGFERPALPAVLTGPGPFVGRVAELERLLSGWQSALAGGTRAVLIAGEPGVGKTRLAGEWSQQAYEQGAVVLYGRCDEDLGAPYQPFAEALRSLVPCIGAKRLRALRGVEALLSLVPALTEVLPDLAAPTRADPDTERYALFDAVVAVFEAASVSAPVVLILDDLHWAAKPTLLLLRHLLRFGDHARVQVVGTYRSTDLDRSHPLAAMLADLHRDGTAERINLSGLDGRDVTAYVAESGYDDEDLANALASVTGGNPFFLIEALRHVEESGGTWDQSTLPQGVREAVSRRLSRLPAETNKALAAAAVVGSRFAVDFVEQVVEDDLVDAFDEACKAGIIIEEPGGRYRFNHAIVRQSLLAELASVRRMRLHQRIATTLEAQSGAEDDELLGELAHHYFECAWAGNAAKAVEYCRRAADQAMARLAYEGAAELYDRALHAMEELDDELPDREDQTAELLVARCEALLAAGDVTSAPDAVSQLRTATVDSARLAAWATCFDGQLSMLIHPERLDEVESELGAAAEELAGLDDAAGEATAHTVRAGCLARLGRIGDCEIALDEALTAARRAREHRRVNAVLAGAPLAALWGPNPVPRAGGRCLDVVRLLRITTDSPAVEATSTRCQAVLEAFRGRAAAARRMIDSARRTVTELGLRHALMEVEQFAGIVELIADDPGAAEPHLRKAYNGFRRMRLDADTAETAALLGRACLVLDRVGEADELCSESQRLAGNALKPSIAWRVLRAHLLSRSENHDEARLVAEAAVELAERTDALVDHGDACLSLAIVLGAAGDAVRARAAAEQAADLYERKGAVGLAERARGVLGAQAQAVVPASDEPPAAESENACVRTCQRLIAAIHSGAWDVVEELYASDGITESRRKIVGFTQIPAADWVPQIRRAVEAGAMRFNRVVIAVRGERLSLARLVVGSTDESPGAPRDEFLSLDGIDSDGRILLTVWFDLDNMDAAMAELDSVHAKFEEAHRQERRLENAATRIFTRFWSCSAAREWGSVAELVAEGFSGIDHRRVVNGGNQHGRDLVIESLRVSGDIGFTLQMVGVTALRGERLALTRVRGSGRDTDAIQEDALNIVEIDADERIISIAVFDLDDFDSAIAELDCRYLAGEAAAHAHTWSMVAESFAALRRQEVPALSPNAMFVDHRRSAAFGSMDLTTYIHAVFDLGEHIRPYVAAVHRLTDLGAVCSYAAQGVSDQGFVAEWQGVDVTTVDGDMLNRCEFFDEADLDKALRRFDELNRPTPRLENAASQVADSFRAHLAAGDWDAVTELVADDMCTDDRRCLVSSGVLEGRDAYMANTRAIAELWSTNITRTVIATRGKSLALARTTFSGRDEGAGAFLTDALIVLEINADERIDSVVVFDAEDFDSAIAELDARYAAGEAAAYSHTWSVVSSLVVAHNRREIAPPTPDMVSIDHRRAAAFAPGEFIDYLRAGWEIGQNLNLYIEAVHRVNDLGAVYTWAGYGSSHEGFDAEWRGVSLTGIEGSRCSRMEVFDDTDLDSALARFDEVCCPTTRRLDNAASQTAARIYAWFAARDWDAMAQGFAEDYSFEDRRRVVNAGTYRGRDAGIEDLRTFADLGFTLTTLGVIATRGGRLALIRATAAGPDPGAVQMVGLNLFEIDADERITAALIFEPDDLDAALEELDARYLAGEAAPYASTWSDVAKAYTTLNQQKLPPTTPDWINLDQRRLASVEAGHLAAYVRDALVSIPGTIYIEAVHRLSDTGAIVSRAVNGTSQHGFEAEWREIDVLMFDDHRINRLEVFDEADLDAALARFDQLSRPAPRRLENAASQVWEHIYAWFAARDWDALGEIAADNFRIEDRRRVVNAGIRHGRDAALADMRVMADVGFELTMVDVTATRGSRLALVRVRASGNDPDVVQNDAYNLAEIDSGGRISAAVVFDLEDFDAAIAELDERYSAGEAAPYARTWSAIAEVYSALNRGELPTPSADFTDVDHRRLAAIGSGDFMAYLGAQPQDATHAGIYVETVHRLTKLGAVTTHVAKETTQDGFDAEWRITSFFIVDGDKVSRYEIFDEEDLDAALARFDELQPQARQLENAASRVHELLKARVVARDWDAVSDFFADDVAIDDRRRVVNSGIQYGREAAVADMRSAAEVGLSSISLSVIATRGERLELCRTCIQYQDRAFRMEFIAVVEIDADERIVARVAFDADDVDAAITELDARYLAGEAAPYSTVWSTLSRGYAALNRHEMPPLTSNARNVDHRRARGFAPGHLAVWLGASWDLMPDASMYVDTVHRLSAAGAVVTQVVRGTTPEGFRAEWRELVVLTSAGDQMSGVELFDEEDFDAALARFNELHPPKAVGPTNAASQVEQRFMNSFAARDWDAIAEFIADDFAMDDRRHTVNSGVSRGRQREIAALKAIADVGVASMTPTVVAVRGDRLALGSYLVSDGWGGTRALSVVEINAENRIVARVGFDAEDFDAAIAELDARYLADEAAPYAQTWSVVTRAHAAVNRREIPATTTDSVYIDHRPLVSIEGVDLAASLRAMFDLTSAFSVYIEAVNRLDELGAVVTQVVNATTHEGVETELRIIEMATVEGDLISRAEVFDEADVDKALARFDELHPQTPRLQNAASRLYDRSNTYLAARDMDAIADLLADDLYSDDRRRLVGNGIQRGRDAQIANLRAIVNVGVKNLESVVVATRGERLALIRTRGSGGDQRPEAFSVEMLNVVELDADNRFAATIQFDLDDFGAAMAELDSRYIAGEAAAHAHTWSLTEEAYAAYNRREISPLTSDWVNIDHRRGIGFAPGEMIPYIQAAWNVTPNVEVCIEAVHRVTDVGSLITAVGRGASLDGFDGEWRYLHLMTFKGDMVSRGEFFDEADLDAALARFDELTQSTPLDNAATRTWARLAEAGNRRDLEEYLALSNSNVRYEDRRRGLRDEFQGLTAQRNAVLAVFEAVPRSVQMTSEPIAVRGSRLALMHVCYRDTDYDERPITVEMMQIVEVDTDGFLGYSVSFDPEDIDAAFAELDSRYIAGEAAAHAHTWSVIAEIQAAVNRLELPAMTPNPGYVDHRPLVAVEGADLAASVRAIFEIHSAYRVYVEAVHRLDDLGAVYTQVHHGTSHDGVEAEWRVVEVQTVEGDLLSRAEVFDETDLDEAIARFDELHPQTPRLENAASQVYERFRRSFAARDWDAVTQMVGDDIFNDDRRRVVNAGVRLGRDATLESMRATAALGLSTNTTTVVATRGERLVLGRERFYIGDERSEAFAAEVLGLNEIDTDGRIVARVVFSLEDFDSAMAELDARYIAGEAAAHPDMWSVMMQVCAATNRRELFATTEDFIDIDHRSVATVGSGDLMAYVHTAINDGDYSIYIEAVHRLSDRGAVATLVASGTSHDGFDGEWRMTNIFTVEGNRINRLEMFDETDLDAALARFDELSRTGNDCDRGDDRGASNRRA